MSETYRKETVVNPQPNAKCGEYVSTIPNPSLHTAQSFLLALLDQGATILNLLSLPGGLLVHWQKTSDGVMSESTKRASLSLLQSMGPGRVAKTLNRITGEAGINAP